MQTRKAKTKTSTTSNANANVNANVNANANADANAKANANATTVQQQQQLQFIPMCSAVRTYLLRLGELILGVGPLDEVEPRLRSRMRFPRPQFLQDLGVVVTPTVTCWLTVCTTTSTTTILQNKKHTNPTQPNPTPAHAHAHAHGEREWISRTSPIFFSKHACLLVCKHATNTEKKKRHDTREENVDTEAVARTV